MRREALTKLLESDNDEGVPSRSSIKREDASAQEQGRRRSSRRSNLGAAALHEDPLEAVGRFHKSRRGCQSMARGECGEIEGLLQLAAAWRSRKIKQ